MPIKYFPEWENVPCVSCDGHGQVLEYSGGGSDFEGAAECADCNGTGRLALHKRSGTLAAYPGGPFRGKIGREDS